MVGCRTPGSTCSTKKNVNVSTTPGPQLGSNLKGNTKVQGFWAPRIAKILRGPPVSSVSFSLDNNLINEAQMEKVAKAFLNDSIEIKIGPSGDNFEAAYTSWKTRRKNPKKKIGRITISQNAGKGAIFHESVHALKDINNYKLTMHEDEVFAYLAGALYNWALSDKKIIAKGETGLIFKAANAIIDSKKMLSKPGTKLQWSDCDALIEAVKAHSAYKSP